jgi:hypothetical protein
MKGFCVFACAVLTACSIPSESYDNKNALQYSKEIGASAYECKGGEFYTAECIFSVPTKNGTQKVTMYCPTNRIAPCTED